MEAIERFFTHLAKNRRHVYVFLSLICFGVYSPTLFNDYNLDDELVTRDHRLTSKGVSAIPEIYSSPYYEDEMGYSYGYRPTVLASFAIEHALFGESPFVGHLINLLLFSATVILIFLLVLQLFPNKWWLAFGTALLFAVHPIHTEVVASIKNRDEILALLFGLLGCFVFIREKFSYWLFPLGLLFFFFGLTSKMSGVALIFLVAASNRRLSFFKDGMLLLSYVTILHYIFDQRDTAKIQLINLVILVLTYLLLSIISCFPNSLKAWVTLWIKQGTALILKRKVVLLRILKCSWTQAKKIILRYLTWLNTSPIRLFNIVTAFSTTFLLIHLQIVVNPHEILLGLVLLSFLIYPSDKPDAFLRLSLVMAFSGEIYAYQLLLVISMIYHTASWNARLVRNYFLLALLIQLVFCLGFNRDVSGAAAWMFFYSLFLGLLYAKDNHQSNRILFRVISSILVVYVVMIIVFERTFSDTFFYPIILILPLTINWIKWNYQFLVSRFFSSRLRTQYTSAIYLAAVIAFSSTLLLSNASTSNSILESANILYNKSYEEIDFTKQMLISYLHPKYNPKEIWTHQDMFSWERPFDYVEHPLSPVAPSSWKLGTALNTLQIYLNRLTAPYPLAFYYGYNEIQVNNISDWRSLLSLIFHTLLVVVMVLFQRKFKPISIGILMYLTSIFLFSGLVEIVAGMFAERFAYVASFGFCLATVGLGLYLTSSFPRLKSPILAAFMVAVCGFSAYSFHRAELWKDKITLMRHDIENVPNSAQAHNLLAHALMEKVFDKSSNLTPHDSEELILEAKEHFITATNIYPQFFNVWVDLGKVNGILNKPEEAISSFEHAVELDSTYTPLYNLIGENAEKLGQLEKATSNFKEYLNRSTGQFEAYDKLARVLFKQKRYQESISICEDYLRLDSTNQDFKNNILYMRSQIELQNTND